MKKLFPLFILLILVSFLPNINANPDIETLWCNSYTANRLGWTHAGATPYLGDTDGSWITIKTEGQTEGDFGFSDLSTAGTITSVTLYIECKADDAPADDGFYVYVFDGSSWTNEGLIQPSQTTYQYMQLSLTTKLGTSDKVNDAQVYFEFKKSKGADDLWIRRVYLYVDYTPSQGQEHTRDLSQSLSWTGNSYRTCNLKRDSSQGITLTSDSLRSWDAHRLLTQSTTLVTTASRDCNYLRTFTQSIFMSLNIFTKHFESIFRSLTLGLNLATESTRTWTLSRHFTQGITLSNLASRTCTLIRNLTQELSFLSSAIGWITEGAEQFLRTLTLSMSLTTESIRSWTLSRTLSQGMTLINNAIGQKVLWELIKRFVTLSLYLTSSIGVSLITEVDIPMLILFLASVFFSYFWWGSKSDDVAIGIVGGIFWISLAFYWIMEISQVYKVIALAFGLLGLFMWVQAFMESLDVLS